MADQLQFESVLTTYGGILSRVAATYEANRDLQQELLQEICLAVWQGLSRYESKSSLKTYILRIAHNRAVTHVNKQVKEPIQAEWDNETESQMITEQVINSAEKNLQSQRDTSRLMTCIRALPLVQKQIMTLSMEGMSYQEIAEISGLTPSNVGVVIARTKQQLKSQLYEE